MKNQIEAPTHASVASLEAHIDTIKANEHPSLYADKARIEWVEEFVAVVRAESDGEGELPTWRVRDPTGEFMGEGESWRDAVDSARRKVKRTGVK